MRSRIVAARNPHRVARVVVIGAIIALTCIVTRGKSDEKDERNKVVSRLIELRAKLDLVSVEHDVERANYRAALRALKAAEQLSDVANMSNVIFWGLMVKGRLIENDVADEGLRQRVKETMQNGHDPIEKDENQRLTARMDDAEKAGRKKFEDVAKRKAELELEIRSLESSLAKRH